MVFDPARSSSIEIEANDGRPELLSPHHLNLGCLIGVGLPITRRLATFGIFSLGQTSLLVHAVDIKTGRCQRRGVIVPKPLSFFFCLVFGT